MEDYKAKFEKLIQRIDDLIVNGWIDEKVGKAILKDFTVENDDERIRKEIIECIKSNALGYPEQIRNKWLAWLEKQATKEQRDLLFRKMKEVGYEWDAEEKELKKIEQKPTWSEEDEIRAAQIISDLEKCTVPGFPVYIGGVELEINWLKSLKERMKGE